MSVSGRIKNTPIIKSMMSSGYMNNSTTWSIRFYSSLIIVLLGINLADAQPSRQSSSFTHFIPSSAGLYISIRDLGELNRALQYAPPQQFLSILSDRDHASTDSLDIRAILTTFLGPDHSVDLDQLMNCEVGIVASSLSDFSRAVWFVRLPDGVTADQWFPEFHDNLPDSSVSVKIIRTPNGLIVCSHKNIIAMARQPVKDTYIRQIYHFMRSKKESSLEKLRSYQELVAYLPTRALGTVYMVPQNNSSSNGSSFVLPVLDRFVVGMYERDGILDFTVRGSTHTPIPTGRVTTQTMERMLDLPATTLFAMVSPLDMDLSLPPEPTSMSSTFSRYLAFLMRYRSTQWLQARPIPKLGPNMIIAWDQDLRVDSSTPELAMMIESQEPVRLREEFTAITKNLIDLFSRSPADQYGLHLKLHQESHLGILIHSLTMTPQLVNPMNSWIALLETLQPSWASWKGWFIFALSRDHLERILDAQFGLVPTLASIKDARSIRQQSPNRSHIAVMQPRMAMDVMNQWIPDSKLTTTVQPHWFSLLINDNPSEQKKLGIGMKTQLVPGLVVVARVYPDTIASGLLQPDDQIIGVDGQLIGMDSPNADLRHLWLTSTSQPGPVFRVIRSGEIMEFILPKHQATEPLTLQSMNPIDVIHDIITLGQTIPFATFVAFVSDERHYSARFSVRLRSQGPS